jgi:hypothetical protein
VAYCPDTDTIRICKLQHDGMSLAPYMAMHDQIAKYRYLIYVDGHCASNRYGALMLSGRVILKVDTEIGEDGGVQWLFNGLVPARVHANGEVDLPEGADHFRINTSYDNLIPTITYLRENDGIAKMVAACSRSKAPSIHTIVSAWKRILVALHHKTVVKNCSPGAVWFSPYDPRYARMGMKSSKSNFTVV